MLLLVVTDNFLDFQHVDSGCPWNPWNHFPAEPVDALGSSRCHLDGLWLPVGGAVKTYWPSNTIRRNYYEICFVSDLPIYGFPLENPEKPEDASIFGIFAISSSFCGKLIEKTCLKAPWWYPASI